MSYDPIKKREYDRIRNARLKAEYLAKNPNYKSSRKSKYEDTQPITNSPSFNFSSLFPPPPPPPPPKPKFNPNGLEARKRDDAYEDDTKPNIHQPPFKFY